MTPLDQAIKLAVEGKYPPGISELDGHEFYIRPVNNKGLLQGDETSYFRHEHIGKDDRVFYAIKFDNSGKYTAKITRIQFRGPFVKNGFRPLGAFGIDVTDAVKVLAAGLAALEGGPQNWLDFLAIAIELDAQGFLDGNWLPAAAKVTDMIGAEMAKQRRAPQVGR